MKVTPKNDELRKILKHPMAGGFLPEGPAEWPDDSFTARRIADGDITVEGQPTPTFPPQPQEPPEESKGKRK